MKSLIAALTLVSILTASAQTLKWTYPIDGVSAWSTDGRGALALVHRTSAVTELAAVTWIDNGGRPFFTNSIADLGQNYAGSNVRIVRFNKTELAVQVEASYEYEPGTNFVRRFHRNGTFSDTVFPSVNEWTRNPPRW